ncbi:MAG: signal peptidase II [Lachnospiraceae bacterium]|nr:signal peptidase II [Lachnospiraceae bacterium]MCR5023083.1 signal peptidase II [Lachnospiraceae bacterium]
MNIRSVFRNNLPYFAFLSGVALIDQIVKHRVEKHPEEFAQVVHNTGFAGEKLKNRPDIVRKTAFALTALGIARLPFMADDSESDRIMKTGWAMIMGGALSNTYDRVIRKYVVDYIPKGKYVYNLGDFAIYSGLSVTIAGAVLDRKGKE